MMTRESPRLLPMAALALLVAVAGCTTLNPYTREEQVSKAGKGAAIGAVAGAVVGAITGDDARDRQKRALIGAGVGAIAGGSVGYYMDVQEAKLRQRLEGTGVSVTRDGDNIILNMPSNITFRTDSSDLSPDFFAVLDSVGLVLEEYDRTVVEVAGHTDSTGSDEYNLDLSFERSRTVGQYLIGEGVMRERVITLGYGERRPIASNDTEQGRASNRRVELTLVPLTDS